MPNSADPDQLASSEANRSGSTLFAKAGYIQVQQDKGYPYDIFSYFSTKTCLSEALPVRPTTFVFVEKYKKCCYFLVEKSALSGAMRYAGLSRPLLFACGIK